jgi:hypothetical protein
MNWYSHSGIVDEHIDPRLFTQLRAHVNLYDIAQLRRYHHCVVLFRPPRGWYSRKSTCSSPFFRSLAHSIPQACDTSPRTLDIPSSTPPCITVHIIYPSAHSLPTGPPPRTTNLDGPTANTDCTAFDAPRPRSFRSPPHTRTQRTSDQLAYGAKGHGSSTSLLACRQYSGRDRCPSWRVRCVGCGHRASRASRAGGRSTPS